MGMLDTMRRRLQEYTGEDETPLDGDTPAWVVSMAIHVAVLLALAIGGFGTTARQAPEITVIETPVEEVQDVLEMPREVTLEDVALEEVGSQSEERFETAQALGPVLGEEPIVPIEPDPMPAPEIKDEPIHLAPTGLQFNETLTVKGDVGVGEAGAGGAVDRLTLEIAASLEQRSTVVCWVFDQSVSLAGQRKEIAARLERVFEELGVTTAANTHDLFNLVYAYGQKVTPVTSAPTRDVSEVVDAIESIPIDPSGLEMTFTAIAEAAKKAKLVRLTGADRRNVMIIVFTDEVGNDQKHADSVAAFCRVQAMRVFVVGVPAPFGRDIVTMKFVEFDPAVCGRRAVGGGRAGAGNLLSRGGRRFGRGTPRTSRSTPGSARSASRSSVPRLTGSTSRCMPIGAHGAGWAIERPLRCRPGCGTFSIPR